MNEDRRAATHAHALAVAMAIAVALAGVLACAPDAALAQGLPGCETARVGDPPRTVSRCAGGLVIEAEPAARLRVVATGDGDRPQLIELQGGAAALIQLAPRGGRFQILTPHAIASVRGTVYAVDVTAAGTAVFVREGRVDVARPDGSASVVLGAGEGVDVAPGTPLVVKTWGAARVRALLDRFGR